MGDSGLDPAYGAPFARLLEDYQDGVRDGVLHITSDLEEVEPIPARVFFRGADALLPFDSEALRLVRGRVLDVGAGGGVHALLLQERGFQVTAIDSLGAAVRVMRARGVLDARHVELAQLEEGRVFDTILALMNGTTLAGSLEGFSGLLSAFARALRVGGQVLIDSTDLRADSRGTTWREDGRYVGEVHYQLEYANTRGAPFPQLFLDEGLLSSLADEGGWGSSVVWRGKGGHYLARLSRA